MIDKVPDAKSLKSESSAAAITAALGTEEALSYRIPRVCHLTGLKRTSIYKAISSGRLRARSFERCTIILRGDLIAFLTDLPEIGHLQAKKKSNVAE
jgi:hypothetical protein